MPNQSGNEPEANGDPGVQVHDTILQHLNREIGDYFFPVESFENATDWETVPVILAQEHPDMSAYDLDPETELARLAETTGRRAAVVGTPANARIETTGRPRLQAELNWGADPDVQRLFNEGKLGISTGFYSQTAGNRLDGLVKPHHILLFEEDPQNQPRDRGVVVLNKETKMQAFTNEGRVLSNKNQTRLNEIFASLKKFIEEIGGGKEGPEMITNTETTPAPDPEPITNMSKNEIASRDAEIAELKNKLETIQAEREEYATKLAQIETEKKETAWQALKNRLPPGMVHTPEDENATRVLFESDPVAFTNKLLEIRTETKPESGAAFTNKGQDDQARVNEILSTRRAIPGTLH